MSPDLAHAANLSLAELIDFTSGARRLSQPQIEALARRMGLLTTPRTGVDVVRDKLRVTMKKWPNFVSHFEWRGSPQALQNFLDGEALTHEEVNWLARELIGKDVSVGEDGQLRRPAPVATPLCAAGHDGPWRHGSNVPFIREMAAAHLRAQLAQLEAQGE